MRKSDKLSKMKEIRKTKNLIKKQQKNYKLKRSKASIIKKRRIGQFPLEKVGYSHWKKVSKAVLREVFSVLDVK